MPQINAFATPEYPVLFSLAGPGEGEHRVPGGQVAVSLALLVKGVPSFLATHLVAESRINDVVASLESGDVRVAVVGLSIELEDEVAEVGAKPGEERSAAFVSVVCQDGRRITVARILGRDRGESPERLARYVVREISRGVQIPELASS